MIAAVFAAVALSVTLIGDSLTVPSAKYTQRAMPNHQFFVDAKGGETTIWGIARLRERKAKGQLGNTVVFALGTNDNPNYPGEFAKRLATVREIIGPKRCLVMPSMYVKGSRKGMNAVMHRYADVWVPWVHAVHVGEVLLYDGIHPGWAFEPVRGRMIAEGIRDCEMNGRRKR